MEANKITFRGLPFSPERSQVLYIENGYDAAANDFICNHYAGLKSMFARMGLDFYYLPYLLSEHDTEAKVRYYAPYLSSGALATKVQSNALVPYIADADARKNLKPSLIFSGTQNVANGDAIFSQMVLSDIDLAQPDALQVLMRTLVGEQCWGIECEEDIADLCVQPSSLEEFSESDMGYELVYMHRRINFDRRIGNIVSAKDEEQAEGLSLINTAEVLRELRMTVQKLRLEGVSLMAIHEFIDRQEPLSRMTITPDYRIFLPDYNNIEIEMGALPKAIYFLYLRYPEGIIYKHMQDYYTELLNIYKQLRPGTDEARLTLTVTKVVNPMGNALNENIARIRKAFVEKFDEHLANNYIITGERGSQYSIPLDRELITWEE